MIFVRHHVHDRDIANVLFPGEVEILAIGVQAKAKLTVFAFQVRQGTFATISERDPP